MHLYYGYNEFRQDVVDLAKMVQKDFKPQAIISILRGGMTLAHFLGLHWDIKEVYAINASSYSSDRTQGDLEIHNVPLLKPQHQNILVVDEIIDSGKSFMGVMRVLQEKYPQVCFKSAVLFAQKSAQFKADYILKEATSWIDFFWEVDTQGDYIA
ncbi:phosphoribosyltransferase [Helicobacter felis]|uniref:Xanthine guanine phosphoribosyl transferase n=1 Tax=Helicobacter felis (strain ATCC 49179 / CCUG 28539 / NCTC 12436 / CS1) TaxID=936155 RepID=E7A9M0_HELFC|nr:phosphoribosyltransferase family protein [Helicobacter felis]CBY82546.1 Xanthine guanine phosphoribosyl transferase [Helicobacter felis ATCC 49179]